MKHLLKRPLKTLLLSFVTLSYLQANSTNRLDLNTTESTETSTRNVNFSMVISGGVSLGSYESGYNWAIIKALAKIKSEHSDKVNPSLRSVTGASAGSINALLSAMYWCQKDTANYKNSVDDNLFYDTWVNLGIEDLVVKDNNSENRSTLFTRKELRNKAKNMMDQMSKPIYKEGCEIPMGFAVTKATPIVEEFQGIKIKNQNFSAPFTFKIKNGKVHIENREMSKDSTEFYISIPNIEKDYTKITDVLFASSAFPGAFQQVKLKYKYKNKVRSNYFIDGGAYDNIPLQLATELDPDANLFIFMDPSNMRKEPELKEEDIKEEPPVGFLTSSASPLSSSIEIFQQMKLYQAINKHFRGNPNRQLVLSSRFHPLTAGYLEHFGAFLDHSFRLYDYHVGVFDAIYHITVKLQKIGYLSKYSLTDAMDIMMKEIGIAKSKEALTAYRFFKAIEFKQTKPKKDNRYAAIYYAFNTSLPDSKRYAAGEFKQFLKKLDMRYIPIEKGSFLDEATSDIEHWAKRPLRNIVNRITTLENERAKIYPTYQTTADLLSIGAWASASFLKEKKGWDILPINAPNDKGNEKLKNLLRFIPTEFSTDTSNGGLSFGYQAYYYDKMSYIDGFDFKASYNFNHDNGDFVRFDADIFNEYDDFVKFGAGLSAFGNIEHSFYDQDTAYGANVYIDLMDIFRLTYVRRHGDIEDNNYLYIGIENMPSLLYWLNR